ncbi:MAG TPA: lysylphosphatidylglycerol synthase transmembrane domain-containing protein [Chloroflexota bacterium]|nr:lysylphosphatidylglycerol synthase transmembrane domain-containing protein [Chloroflexota bacterium]
MNRTAQVLLGAAISLICVVLALRGLDLAQVWRALAQARYVLLLPAIALYFAGVWVRSVRWQQLLWPIRRVPAARLFPVVVIGYMANDVLPLRLGEVARCFVLRRREGIAQTAALGTVLVERVMDGLTMLAFMGLTLPLLPFSAALYQLMGAAGVLFLVVTIALAALALRPAFAERVLDLSLKPLPAGVRTRIRSVVLSFLSGVAALGGASAALRVFGLSCAAWLLEAAMYLVLMFAFPIIPSAVLAVLTTAVANLGTLVPSSPGYVGVFDFIGRSVLAQFGVPDEAALAYVLVVHAALIVPVTLLGFVFTWQEGVSLREVAK